jgi:sec-independent protein translocase protein TatA
MKYFPVEVKTMFRLGPMELVLIFVILLLVFGAKKIPEIFRGVGEGIREFKKTTKDTSDNSVEQSDARSKKKDDRKED